MAEEQQQQQVEDVLQTARSKFSIQITSATTMHIEIAREQCKSSSCNISTLLLHNGRQYASNFVVKRKWIASMQQQLMKWSLSLPHQLPKEPSAKDTRQLFCDNCNQSFNKALQLCFDIERSIKFSCQSLVTIIECFNHSPNGRSRLLTNGSNYNNSNGSNIGDSSNESNMNIIDNSNEISNSISDGKSNDSNNNGNDNIAYCSDNSNVDSNINEKSNWNNNNNSNSHNINNGNINNINNISNNADSSDNSNSNINDKSNIDSYSISNDNNENINENINHITNISNNNIGDCSDNSNSKIINTSNINVNSNINEKSNNISISNGNSNDINNIGDCSTSIGTVTTSGMERATTLKTLETAVLTATSLRKATFINDNSNINVNSNIISNDSNPINNVNLKCNRNCNVSSNIDESNDTDGNSESDSNSDRECVINNSDKDLNLNARFVNLVDYVQLAESEAAATVAATALLNVDFQYARQMWPMMMGSESVDTDEDKDGFVNGDEDVDNEDVDDKDVDDKGAYDKDADNKDDEDVDDLHHVHVDNVEDVDDKDVNVKDVNDDEDEEEDVNYDEDNKDEGFNDDVGDTAEDVADDVGDSAEDHQVRDLNELSVRLVQTNSTNSLPVVCNVDLGSYNSIDNIDDQWSELGCKKAGIDEWLQSEDRSFETNLSRPLRRLIGELPAQTALEERLTWLIDEEANYVAPAVVEDERSSRWRLYQDLCSPDVRLLIRQSINELAYLQQNLNRIDVQQELRYENEESDEEEASSSCNYEPELELEIVPLASYVKQTAELIAQIKATL
ncbi:protein PFC0760c-like [Drosophila albomicans]|uniref:Protein PFC0760c-like n=1 Tax=Drosophila albomicans TaxID=7291 RepID=A0A9C6T5N4_DROAB|nr:protein PFC0760c-like [Drosophila albomicans]